MWLLISIRPPLSLHQTGLSTFNLQPHIKAPTSIPVWYLPRFHDILHALIAEPTPSAIAFPFFIGSNLSSFFSPLKFPVTLHAKVTRAQRTISYIPWLQASAYPAQS
jgi:hypothetical protein